MTRFLAPRAATALLLGIPILLGAVPAADTAAQTSMPQQEMSALSAAIEGARRSPFHRNRSATVFVGPGYTAGTYLTTTLAQGGVAKVVSQQRPDGSRVFLASLAVAAVTDFYGLSLLLCSGGDSGCDVPKSLSVPVSLTLSTFGPAIAARLAGGHFGPAIWGSALGFGIGGLLAIAAGQLGGLVGLATLPLAHAGLTTIFAVNVGPAG